MLGKPTIGSLAAIAAVIYVVVAILVVSAPSAASEAKPEFRVAEVPGMIEGEQIAKKKLVLTTSNGTVECSTALFVNTAWTQTATSTMEVVPFFSSCNVFGQLGIQPKMNGCSFLFHLVPGGGGEATVDIPCPMGKEMEFPGVKCKVTVPEQKNVGHVVFYETPSEEPGDIDGEFTLIELKYKEGTGCKASGETTNGSWVGNVTFTASNELLKPQRLWIE